MPSRSSLHAYLNWTKQRIDEMDAALASLESQASQLKDKSRQKADELIAAMKSRRDKFKAEAEAQAQAGDTALRANKEKLAAQARDFEAQVKTYVDTVGEQIEQQQAMFRDVVASHIRAWAAAADTFHAEAAKIAAARRASLDAAVEQMKADAREAEARLNRLKQSGSDTWDALSAALDESRKAFDRANQKAGDALVTAATASTADAAKR